MTKKKLKDLHVNSIKTIGINRFNCNKLRLMSDHFKQMSLYVDYIETDILCEDRFHLIQFERLCIYEMTT
jgi:hypothetical protein